MFGNKYAADELAKNFQNRVNTLKKAKEESVSAIKKEAKKSIAREDAAAFLIDSKAETMSSAIDNSIKDMSADDKCSMCNMAHDAKDGCAKDGACGKCSMVHDAKDGCAKDSSVMDKTAYIHKKLTKIAKGLERKGASEAARVVSDAAKDFLPKSAKSSKVEKIAKKQEDLGYLVDQKSEYVLMELGKIASDLQLNGAKFAADMVEATAMDIRKEAVEKAMTKFEVVENLKKMASDSYAEGDAMTADVIRATILNIKRG